MKLFYRTGNQITIWGERNGAEVTTTDRETQTLPTINAAKRTSRGMQKSGLKFERSAS